ncbi:MAG TPA: ATP-binding protein [Opitutaceae bacterium]|jgi:signal transduction histidine kinase
MPTILVVDDEPVFLQGVKMMLHRYGYETIEANSAADGFRLARSQQPNLIVSDVSMTSDDGFGLLTDLRANPLTATIPVILMSGGTDIEKARRSMALGADDFLEKPFKAEWLIESVKAQLRKHDKVHQEAVQTKARMVAILEATPNLVSIVDATTQTVVYLNRAGHRMLNFSDGLDVASCRLSEFFRPDRYAQIERDALPSALQGGVWRGESQLLTADDKEVPVSVLLQAHKGIEGNVEFLSLVIHDQTEQRRAEADRQKVEIQLRNAQKLESIGRLAAGIAHEINTPTQYIGDNTRFLQDAFGDLRVLIGRADELLKAAEARQVTPELVSRVREARAAADLDVLEEEIPKAIEQSLIGIERVTKIVRAMKEFSHPGSEEKAPLDVNRAIETTLTVCRGEWKYVADVVTHFAAELPPVPCLAGQFNQVILNLVVNAAHAISDVVGDGAKGKGKIEIATERAGDRLEIRIKDSGTGMPPSVREHLFEPFFTTKGVGSGTGQGLALARTIIVDQHGGTIDYETEVGKGTTFIIRMPIDGS